MLQGTTFTASLLLINIASLLLIVYYFPERWSNSYAYKENYTSDVGNSLLISTLSYYSEILKSTIYNRLFNYFLKKIYCMNPWRYDIEVVKTQNIRKHIHASTIISTTLSVKKKPELILVG